MSLGVPQFPMAGSAQLAGNGSRNKVGLKPGRSLMDWIRLANSGKDLTGTQGRVLRVTPEELAKHNKPGDCWMGLRGKVYNISAYMDFHPGGEDELMKGAGIDGTQLFDEVHRWVNAESMLEKCFVGFLEGGPPPGKAKTTPKRGSLTTNGPSLLLPPQAPFVAPSTRTNKSDTNMGPPPSLQVSVATPVNWKPRYDWIQTDSSLTLVVYTKNKKLRTEDVMIEKKEQDLKVLVVIKDMVFQIHVELAAAVENEYNVKVHSTGKCDVVLSKTIQGQPWQNKAKPLEGDQTFIPREIQQPCYFSCSLVSVSELTHDCRLLTFSLPAGVRMQVPLGYHVLARADVLGMEISRFYTVVPPSILDNESASDAGGHQLHLMIKIYENGALTPIIGNLEIGGALDLSSYEGTFEEERLAACTHLVMLAAGTGITPMAGLIHAAINKHPKPGRHIQLMFFNKEEKDVVWRDQLDKLSTEHGAEVTYILSQPHPEWTGATGRVRRELLEGALPVPQANKDILFCACGPAVFTEEAIRLAKELGYTDAMIHAFVG